MAFDLATNVSLLSTHANRQGVDISFTVLFVCVFCVCVCTVTISQPRIKLAVSYFAWQFIGVQGRESQIFVNFAPQKHKIVPIDRRAGHAHPYVNITAEMHRRKRHAREMCHSNVLCGM